MTPPPKRHPVRKAGWILFFVVLSLLVAYPIVGNAVLALGLVQKAFEGTDQVKVTFRRAWTFWPGKVHVEDARVIMQDRNVQFALILPAVDVDLDLWAFTHRTFHATRVRGSNVVYRFRHRIEPESKNAPFVSALPPIGEFDDPPLREAGPPTAPLDEAHYNLWTVHIDDVDVKVSELWAQMIRFQGEAHVVGAFRLRPAKRLWVGPATLEFLSGTLTTGANDILNGMQGKLDVTVDDFDVEPVKGMEPFRFIDARMQLKAQVANLNAVNFLADAPFKMEDGSGQIDIDMHADHAVFTEDTRFAYRTDHLGVNTEKFPVHLDGEMNVLANGEGAGWHVRTVAPHGVFRMGTTRLPPPSFHDVELSFETTSRDITEDWEITKRAARLRELRLADLRWVNELPVLPKHTWKIASGSAKFGGHATLDDHDLINGALRGAIDSAEMNVGESKVRVTADVDVQASGTAANGAVGKSRILAGDIEFISSGAEAILSRAVIDVDSQMSPKDGVIADMRAVSGDWVARLGDSRVSGAHLMAQGKLVDSSLTARADLEDMNLSLLGACPWGGAEKATVAIHLDASGEATPRGVVDANVEGASIKWGKFQTLAEHTQIRGALRDNGLQVRVDARALSMKNEGGAPRGWQADVGRLTLTSDLVLGDKGAKGPAQLFLQDASGQIGKTAVRGDISANIALDSPNSSHRTADLSGSIDIRNVALKAGEKEIKDWWAQLQLDRAKLDMRQDFDVSGKIKARLRDGLPALYVLASTEEIPSWLPSVMPLQDITLDLGVERYCRWTDIQVDDARGGPIAAEGRVQIQPGETKGALLLRLAALKPVAVGLNFVEDYSHAAPLAGHGWLEKHLVPLTTSATEKHDARCIPQPPTCE